MTEPTEDCDDDRLPALLRTVDADPAPPDPEALARVRRLSAEAFAAAAPVRPASAELRSRVMPLLPLRFAVACSVIVAGLAAWFSVGVPGGSRVALADILRDVSAADALHLQVVRDDQSVNVFVQQPGRVRWERSSTEYAIVDGSSFWRMDAGELTPSHDAPPRWLNEAGQIDLLGLLDLSVIGSAMTEPLRPAGEADYNGRPCRVYSRPLGEQALRLDVYADARTNRFVALAAREPQADLDAPPLAEVRLIALNPKLDGQAFVVSKTLADRDPGKITVVQGLVTLRPRVSDRWTLVCRETPLAVGDWVRTDPRGAHAAKLTLASGVQVILGPGTLLELTDAQQVRLTAGECQIERTSAAKEPFALLGPGQQRQTLADVGKHRFRISKDQLQPLEAVPVWLAGFEGTTANESLGSLIVTVDGRSEPLTVGEHRVTVDIRDQIARTTIEETFVNRTAARLEGVFHFPLPQDASIGGFAMWIGNELVEADIVEKQRAREIYETILREKRDPGLLEWTGGNIFKARVFPIEPHSEKRIKITYTQVLPLRGNQYRYSYGLRSDLLQKFPLRELFVQVNVHSALPLVRVTSPTHDCRTQSTPHSARLEFTATEYTPTRDFEAVCEVDGSQSPVVVVPHRRGDDGYLLLQLLPPGPDQTWQRETLPKGEPLDLLVLCDTSGSMDGTMRKMQAEFVAALLSSLGPRDRFNVGVCDVNTTWLFPEATTATDVTRAQVREQLAQRVSLGWTDLDAAVAAALTKSTTNAQIVYVGDGIPVTVESDPQAFVSRLRTAVARAVANQESFKSGPPTWHAVSCGSTYESVVLRGLAEIGRGSVRQITGEQTPTVVAQELLNEILQPGLKDLQVEFRGVRVAAVYPERLPNLPAGMQQILVGRYLPTGSDQQGEVVITGRRGDEPVRYVAKIRFADAEAGNSFIPRLWARAHLDQLLQQGPSDFVKDEIIRLSGDFHIITPYTSLLVLETDADRERFGVRKRYEMRDGERFFADGKANLRYDLLQQQMRLAEAWRLGLRRQVLAEWARLGRNPELFDRSSRDSRRRSGLAGVLGRGGYAGASDSGPMSGVPFRRSDRFYRQLSLGDDWDQSHDSLWESLSAAPGPADRSEFSFLAMSNSTRDGLDKALYDVDEVLNVSLNEVEWASVNLPVGGPIAVGMDWKAISDRRAQRAAGRPMTVFDPYPAGFGDYETNGVMLYATPPILVAEKAKLQLGVPGGSLGGGAFGGSAGRAQSSARRPTAEWLSLFPTLAAAPAPASARKPPAWWTADVLDVVRPLRNADALRQVAGLEIRRHRQIFDLGRQRLIDGGERLELVSPTAWLTRDAGQGSPTTLDWCDGADRGAVNLALQLGAIRPAEHADVAWFQSLLVEAPLEETYRHYIPTVARPRPDRAVLSLSHRSSALGTVRITIDTARQVITQIEQLDEAGKLTLTQTRSEFVEVGGILVPTKHVMTEATGRDVAITTLTVTVHDANAFTQRLTAEMAPKDAALLVRGPFPKLVEARRKLAAGQLSVEDRLTVMLDATFRQQWDELFQQLAALERARPDHPGLAWLRIGVEKTAGRREEARAQLFAAAERLVNDDSPDAMARAQHVLAQAYGIAGWNEYAPFVATLRPVYARQADANLALHAWNLKHAEVLRHTGRMDEFLALRQTLAQEVFGDTQEQTAHARLLAEFGRYDAAYEWLQTALASPLHQEPSRQRDLKDTFARLLRQQARWTDLVAYLQAWIVLGPEHDEPYGELLSALIFADRLSDAEATARDWLAQSRVDRKLTAPEIARFEAALAFALGDIRHVSSRSEVRPEWHALLEETAAHFLAHPHHASYATRIVGHHRFQSTDAANRIRGRIRQRLLADGATLPPGVLHEFVAQTLHHRCLMVLGPDALRVEMVPDTERTTLAQAIRARWDAEPNAAVRRQLGDTLVAIYAAKFAETEHLPFLRQRLAISSRAFAERGPDAVEQLEPSAADYVEADRQALYAALLARPWTNEIESELFALLPQFDADAEPAARLFAAVGRLHQLVDKLLAARVAAATKPFTDANATEQLTRTELQAKQRELQETAKRELSDRLQAEGAKLVDVSHQAAWYRMEQLTLDVQLGRHLDVSLGECWELLGAAPPQFDPEAEFTREEAVRELSRGLLRQRALVVVLHLAAQPRAEADLVTRVVDYVDAGLQQAGELAAAWKSLKYQLLVALDRPEELERELRGWIAADPAHVPFRLSLAKLRAERGDVPEAIALFEAIQQTTPLDPPDSALLSQLYLAADRRADHERMRRMAYERIEEWRLSNEISQFRSRLQQHVGEVDEALLDRLHALFAKTTNPESYLWQLRDLFQTTRDYRLLRMAPDVALGRTREQVYNVLVSIDGNLLVSLKEAAADEILARVAERRAEIRAELSRLAEIPEETLRAKRLDLRALDLIEALVERRSAEVPNQGGVHAAAAVAAFRRAFDGDWQPGERRQFAAVLRSLGRCSQRELAVEQVRLLRELIRQAGPESDDGVQITGDLAHVLFWHDPQNTVVEDGRREALSLLENAVRGLFARHDGRWPDRWNGMLDEYLAQLQDARQYSTAEALLDRCVDNLENADKRRPFEDRRLTVWIHALRHDGTVSAGRGDQLFKALVERAVAQIRMADDNRRHGAVEQALQMFDAACEWSQQTAAPELERFALEMLPDLLTPSMSNYHSSVSQTADRLGQRVSKLSELKFLVTMFERYPGRFQFGWDDPWQRHGSRLARCRAEAGPLGDLEPRLLKLVLAHLRLRLVSQESHQNELYRRNYQHFWVEKAADFARVAEAVLAEQRNSPRVIAHTAEYLFHGLEQRPRAIEVLFVAHRRGVLDDNGIDRLADWLTQTNRHGEAAPLLEQLVDRHPHVLSYRTRLMTAYHSSQRPQQVREVYERILTDFRRDGLWTAENISSVGYTCLTCELKTEAVTHLGEAITRRLRSSPTGGRGDDTLSTWYQHLASAHANLGQTAEAVEAASGAIVSWPANHHRRQDALNTLQRVVREARDLDGYVASVNQKADETGQDSPIIRQAIGLAYRQQNQHDKALVQFQLAHELQPNNRDINTALLAEYDALQDHAGAVRQLLAMVELDRHNLELFKQLAERTKSDELLSERAATSLVESAPNEAEHHRALAEWRQTQNRWSDAIPHWERVAELRKLEPTGLLKLATALIHEKRFDQARDVLDRLQKTDWPERFNNVRHEADALRRQLPKP